MSSPLRRPDRRGRALRLPAGCGIGSKLQTDRRAARWNLWRRPTSWPRWGLQGSAQWMVAFALETDDGRVRAVDKLRRKRCDLVVLNRPAAIHAAEYRSGGAGRERPGRGVVCGREDAGGDRDLPHHRGAIDAGRRGRGTLVGLIGTWGAGIEDSRPLAPRSACLEGFPRFVAVGRPPATPLGDWKNRWPIGIT